MSTKPVIVYGASGYTGRLICEYLREYNVAVHRRRPRQGAHRRGPGQGARHRHRRARDRRGRARRRAADRAVRGRQRRLQHRRAVRPVRRRGRRGLHHRRLPLPGHHRRAGLADHLRRAVRQADGGKGPAAGAGHRPDVHHRRDRRPALPGEAGRRHARHPGLLEGHADHRLDPDDPGQRVPVQGVLPGAEPVRGMARRRRPVRRGGARPARDRPGPAVGRHLAPGVVQARPAGGQRQGARRRVQPPAHAGRAADREGRSSSRSRACPRARSCGCSPSRPRP